jgi:hypothetical protein
MERYLHRLERVNLGSGNSWDMDMLVRRVATFVQSLPYRQVQARVMTPLDTLYHGTGVCRDTSVLAAAFFHALDYPVVYVRTPRHVFVAIANAGTFSGKTVTHDGQDYYYLETTTDLPVGAGDDREVQSIIPVDPADGNSNE